MLLISNMYPSLSHPTYGTFIRNFELQMQTEGFVVDKCVISGRGKNIFEKIKKYIRFFKQTIHAIHQEDFDLIYVHYINHSLLPLLWLKKITKPLVLNAHGSDVRPRSTVDKLLQRISIPVIKNADLIVVPSEYFKSIVNNKFSFDAKKIFVSPSGGIDTALFSKKKYYPNEKLTIGYVSRIDKSKGWNIFLTALKSVKEKTDHDFTAIIIGDGPDMADLKKSVKKYDLSQEVSILGAIDHNELPDYYHSMNLFIFPTLAESLGLVGLEAMSCGIPILGSDIPALREYISPNISGDLFETNNAKDLFTKIDNFVFLSPEKKKDLSNAARDTALNYEAGKTAHDLNEKLTHIIAKTEYDA